MLYDLNDIRENPFKGKSFDICIIGGGMAGITLALYLDKSLDVLLLEAGGMDYSEESQNVYVGESIGFTSYTLKNRGGRWLGGSSNLWAGRCHPYTSDDFKKRDHIKYSGWPIQKKDLDPYHEETKKILDLPVHHKQKFYKGWTDILEKPNEYFTAIKFFYSRPPTNFRTKYESELKSRKNIHCYINANLTDMILNESLSDIEKIEVQNYKKGLFDVTAKRFVLAAGGIEIPRLLLNFNKQLSKGIGNENDLLGRFFSDHPHSHVGYIVIEDDAANAFLGKEKPEQSEYAFSSLIPTEKFQKNEKLENFMLQVSPFSYVFSRSTYFKNKLKDILCSTEITKNLTENVMSCSPHYHHDGELMILQEQEPNPASRVSLGTEVDRFGLKRAVLDWQFVENDMQTCKKATIRFAKTFARSNLGRVKVDEWLLQPNIKYDTKHMGGGFHHMGTTRMGISPTEGVVDSNAKVFGVGNLYIAGPSIFPTGGCTNAGYTVVQMTLRLADHLNKS